MIYRSKMSGIITANGPDIRYYEDYLGRLKAYLNKTDWKEVTVRDSYGINQEIKEITQLINDLK